MVFQKQNKSFISHPLLNIFFFAYLIVLNPTISHERDRYVKSVMYKNHKFPVCFGNTSIS